MEYVTSDLTFKNGSHKKTYQFFFSAEELSGALVKSSVEPHLREEFDRFVKKMGTDVLLTSRVEVTVDLLDVDKTEEPFNELPEGSGMISISVRGHVGVAVREGVKDKENIAEKFIEGFSDDFLQILTPLGPQIFDRGFKEDLVIEVAKFNGIIPEGEEGTLHLEEHLNQIKTGEGTLQ